ncbi:hypothetical protein [Marinibactrum halimedae]|uniref:Uncharacterized protein n=1 Tax=Marinibactrum halimedae TaxID=1444977 RepID=A0AA37T6H7_9GAMM|nr:hypothetical protein [Marinibactrum halimedae]MCD9461037.1 hypothetical protein [Marinibactrum halimedae]GLS24415.1 hypothetical protein GCM10007877_01260 [Marinibactrum halimedae]
MSEKRDFSLDEIASVATEAGKQAKKESLDAGITPLYKDIETDEYYIIEQKLDGSEQRKYITKEEAEALHS